MATKTLTALFAAPAVGAAPVVSTEAQGLQDRIRGARKAPQEADRASPSSGRRDDERRRAEADRRWLGLYRGRR